MVGVQLEKESVYFQNQEKKKKQKGQTLNKSIFLMLMLATSPGSFNMGNPKAIRKEHLHIFSWTGGRGGQRGSQVSSRGVS